MALQRECIDALDQQLAATTVRRMDAFLSGTLSGIVSCEARAGLAHLPSREVSRWLGGATGHPNPRAVLPTPPPFLVALPTSDDQRLAYQRNCMAWVRRSLPLRISRSGDDPDTAAADAFAAVEDCDSAAGFAAISRERYMELIKTKVLSARGTRQAAVIAPESSKGIT